MEIILCVQGFYYLFLLWGFSPSCLRGPRLVQQLSYMQQQRSCGSSALVPAGAHFPPGLGSMLHGVDVVMGCIGVKGRVDTLAPPAAIVFIFHRGSPSPTSDSAFG